MATLSNLLWLTSINFFILLKSNFSFSFPSASWPPCTKHIFPLLQASTRGWFSNIDLSNPIRIKPTLHPLEFIRELVARVDETIICLIFFLSFIGRSFKVTLSDFFMPWDKSKLVVSALPEEIIFFVSVLKTTESVKVPPASKPIISDILSSFIKIFFLGNLL